LYPNDFLALVATASRNLKISMMLIGGWIFTNSLDDSDVKLEELGRAH